VQSPIIFAIKNKGRAIFKSPPLPALSSIKSNGGEEKARARAKKPKPELLILLWLFPCMLYPIANSYRIGSLAVGIIYLLAVSK
jgi:hypothetical protein